MKNEKLDQQDLKLVNGGMFWCCKDNLQEDLDWKIIGKQKKDMGWEEDDDRALCYEVKVDDKYWTEREGRYIAVEYLL